MAGQEGLQVGAHTDRAHARSAATVRNTECFMQVQVRHICAELARRRNTHQGIEVGAVHIHLAAVFMHNIA